LIARHSLRHGIRGGAGLVSIALTLLIGLGAANCAIGPLEGAQKQVDVMVDHSQIDAADRAAAKDRASQGVVKIASKAIDWAVDPSADQLHYLTEEQPAMVSAVLVLLFLVTPLFACLGGFNQTSGDIATKGLRFLLIRTERDNIFIGRFVGTYLFSAFVNLMLFLILAIYMVAKVKVHPASDMFLWIMQGYLRMMIFTLPYICLCAWISCAIDSSFGSLAISLLLAYVLPLVIGVGASVEPAVRYGQYITPWGYKYWLLEPFGGTLLAGIGIMLAFSAAFLFLGHRYFTQRDL